jgi:hypothetical protein
MNLKNIVAVSGEQSLFKLVSNKNNGLILSNLDNGKVQFFSMRSYQFTPLETVGIYTMSDTVDLPEIFSKIRSSDLEIPPTTNKTPNKIVMDYFVQIVPDYDSDRVHGRDVKKVLKWYFRAQENGLLDASPEEE